MNWFYKNKSRFQVLFFLCSAIASMAYSETKSKGIDAGVARFDLSVKSQGDKKHRAHRHQACKGDRAAILNLYAVTDAAFAAGDLETWAEFYTDDVVAFYPNVPLISGIDAVKAGIAGLFGDPNVTVTITPDVIEIAKSCDLAVAYGHGITRIFDPASGQYLVEHSKWVTMLKKQRDGSWKAAADIFNADGPFAPEGQQE